MSVDGRSAIRRLGAESGRVALLGVAATRRVEAALAATLPPHTLMQRAGDAVARLALAIAPHAREIVVVAGPGNNGGDGYEAALRLRALGKAVRVVAVAPAASPPADATASLGRAAAAGVPIADAWPADDGQIDLVVDALLGIGLSRPPTAALADAIAAIGALRRRGCPVLAVDVPSGLDADGGAPIAGTDAQGAAVVATHTVALLAAKPGLLTHRGRDHAGTVWLATLGADALVAGEADAWLVGRRGTQAPVQPLHASHKGTRGDVVIVGGADGMVGAAVLAARAALIGGAGRVVVDCLSRDGVASGGDPGWPELMWRATEDDAPATRQRSTVVAGCGGGTAVAAALPRLLGDATRLVLDADALNAVAADPSLADALSARRSRGQATVLTPHPLEAARLAGTDVAAVQRNRVVTARDLADRFGCVVVLKGSGTVIAAPGGGAPHIAATGGPALATAGTGDVLAGWIGGRWSRAAGSPAPSEALALAFQVATTAVVEHGWAGERPGAVLTAGSLIDRLAILDGD
jgi:hydroxyethylthiazole kinase-like uncharacterized protein yjeF